MTQHHDATPDRTPWWRPLFAHPAALPTLVLALLAARVCWHIFFSDLTLVEDEAHYWEWARHLDWSYYSKGPGVAWVIALSTRLFGDSEWAVRLPAAVSTAVGMLGAAAAARWAFPDRRELPALAALLYALIPGFAISAMLMTIDAPYLACWMWAAAFATGAILRARHRLWLGCGLAIAAGFLFKYTILLLVPSIILAAWATRHARPRLSRPAIAAATLLASLGLIPVAIWNANHDWATVRHLMGHLSLPGGDTENTIAHNPPWTIAWFFEYLVVQAFVCGPVLALAALAWTRSRTNPDAHTPVRALIAMGLPLFLFYAAVALKTQAEGNWAMAGACTLVVPAAWVVVEGVRAHAHTVRFFWGAALVMGIGCTLTLPAARFLRDHPVIGEHIPLHRFTGMREHAAAVQSALDTIRRDTGREPFIMTDHYGRASQLAFYLPGHPTVYAASSMIGGRRTQYDLWPETDLTNPDTIARLTGRPALLLGSIGAKRWSLGFDGLSEIGPLPGEPKPADRTAFTAAAFRGFDPLPATDPTDAPEQP